MTAASTHTTASTGLLRFATAGAVDDGKSTLIGRLLHDSQSLLSDQLAAVEEASRERGDTEVDLAMLTDGLRAEREQGITIDVAHRYFETPARSFIIADTPGHAQYTRNMVTGASNAELAVVLVDARHGLTEQSRRHAVLAGLLRVPQLVLAVNKMDLVDYDREVFEQIRKDFGELVAALNVDEITSIPISALRGDNVVSESDAMPWYEGPSLLRHLETVQVASVHQPGGLRFPVQYVIRPQAGPHGDYRGYAGQLAGGVVAEGDEVMHLPSGLRTRIAGIDVGDRTLDEARPPLSVTLRMTDQLDVSRGDMICHPADAPTVADRIEATVCWMTPEPALKVGSRLLFKHTTRTTQAMVTDLKYELDVTTLEHEQADELRLNDIGVVGLQLAQPLFCDAYDRNRITGGGLLIDEATNTTAGAVMINRTL